MPANKDVKFYVKNRIANSRAESGLSQEKMAAQLYISLRAYSKIEHGENCCSIETLSHYVENFDVDAEKLLSDIAKISRKNKE